SYVVNATNLTATDSIRELTIIHAPEQAPQYLVPDGQGGWTNLPPDRLETPFAGSDFLVSDLGLEFLHWPVQKILKREVHRSCGCTVLESTNPHPGPQGYARVVAWIDTDSLGIVEAYAYDAAGRKLKDFYPKLIGQRQEQTLVMENLQTDTRTRLELKLKP
ncbi:MAG TPA: outer membrane lipoprotein-sorting protein, partial [Verrucomicrobiae bacterium]